MNHSCETWRYWYRLLKDSEAVYESILFGTDAELRFIIKSWFLPWSTGLKEAGQAPGTTVPPDNSLAHQPSSVITPHNIRLYS